MSPVNVYIYIYIYINYFLFMCSGLNPGVNGLPLKGWPLTVSSILELIFSGDIIKYIACCLQPRPL